MVDLIEASVYSATDLDIADVQLVREVVRRYLKEHGSEINLESGVPEVHDAQLEQHAWRRMTRLAPAMETQIWRNVTLSL